MWKVIYNYGSKKLFVSLPDNEKSEMNRYQPCNVMVDMCNNLIKSLGKIRLEEDPNSYFNALSGSLPKQLAELHIFTFSVGMNQLSGPLPSWLGKWNQMDSPWLNNNQLVGRIDQRLEIVPCWSILDWAATSCLVPSKENCVIQNLLWRLILMGICFQKLLKMFLIGVPILVSWY